jgi:hypothetical protein
LKSTLNSASFDTHKLQIMKKTNFWTLYSAWPPEKHELSSKGHLTKTLFLLFSVHKMNTFQGDSNSKSNFRKSAHPTSLLFPAHANPKKTRRALLRYSTLREPGFQRRVKVVLSGLLCTGSMIPPCAWIIRQSLGLAQTTQPLSV